MLFYIHYVKKGQNCPYSGKKSITISMFKMQKNTFQTTTQIGQLVVAGRAISVARSGSSSCPLGQHQLPDECSTYLKRLISIIFSPKPQIINHFCIWRTCLLNFAGLSGHEKESSFVRQVPQHVSWLPVRLQY